MRCGLAVVGLLLALLVPARARAAFDPLKDARDNFEYGNYKEANRLAEDLLSTHQLAGERDLVDAYRIAGLSNFYLGHTNEARDNFISLLGLDPDYTMDPFLVPPAAVAFFDGIKRDNESKLAPIRAQRKAIAEQERQEEELRRKLLEEDLRRRIEPDRPVLVERVERRTYALNFLPFGVGQFQEDRPVMGGIFAFTQAASLGLSIYSYFYIESLRDPNGLYPHAEVNTATNFQYIKFTSLAVFGAAYLGGVVESLVRYEGSVSRIEPLPQPPQRGPGPPAGPPPSPHARLFLFPWASPDGAGLAAHLSF